MFKIKTQKEFYTDYAIKEGNIPTEGNINLFGVRLKKEVVDIYNRFRIVLGDKPLPWIRIENYEVNEIVEYNDKNYICIEENINKAPDKETKYWRLVKNSDISSINFDNYLAKDNQTEYDPAKMQAHENSNEYHPTTVKHVEARLDYWFKNVSVENANNLGGKPPSYYVNQDTIKEFAKTVLTHSDIIDNLITDENTSALSSRQGKVLKEMIDKILVTLKVNDVDLDELQEVVNYIKQNRKIIEENVDFKQNAVTKDTIVNNLTTNDPNKVLSAAQGKILDEKIQNVSDKLTSNDPKYDSLQKVIDQIKQDKQETTNFNKNAVTKDNIVNNLTTNDPNKVLSAAQGKVLNDSIQNINNKLTINNPNYNSLQDIIDKIEQNKQESDTNSGFYARLDKSSAPLKNNSIDLGSATSMFANMHSNSFVGNYLKAKLADVAEIYPSDMEFEAGTVVGISKTGTLEKFNKNTKYFGVVSEAPAIILNKDVKGIPIVLKGMSPVLVSNHVNVSDYIYADDNGLAFGSEIYRFDLQDKYIGIALETGNGKINTKI